MNRNAKYVVGVLFVILAVALFLRSWNISQQDILGDEAADAFRSVGYIDYLGTSVQTQPIDWYKDAALPWWTKLSFHDDPPLVFLTQHLFFRIFGDTAPAAKLPSILWGLVSTILLYLIVKKLFPLVSVSVKGNRPDVLNYHAIFSALVFAISGASVWIFRTSLLEPFLLGALLLNVYCFLLFVENRKDFWLFGITLGFVALTKYTGVFLLPVYAVYLLAQNRRIFISWQFWAALVLAGLVFSPVIVYNIYLYQTRGHFDLQFAYLLGQKTPEWAGLIGKTKDPFNDIVYNLPALYSILEMIVVLWGAGVGIWLFLKSKVNSGVVDAHARSGIGFWLLYAIFLTLLLLKIGSAPRFLVLYIPVFVVFIALILSRLWQKSGWLGAICKGSVVLLLAFELWFAWQINFVKIHDYGVNKLDAYFAQEFNGRESGSIPQTDNKNLNAVIAEFAARKSEGVPRHLSMIVYNDNIANDILLWIYYRYFFYRNVPTLYTENFIRFLREKESKVLKDFTIYFVQSTENVPINTFKQDKKVSAEFERQLRAQGKEPVKIIIGNDDKEMFRIYKFTMGGRREARHVVAHGSDSSRPATG